MEAAANEQLAAATTCSPRRASTPRSSTRASRRSPGAASRAPREGRRRAPRPAEDLAGPFLATSSGAKQTASAGEFAAARSSPLPLLLPTCIAADLWRAGGSGSLSRSRQACRATRTGLRAADDDVGRMRRPPEQRRPSDCGQSEYCQSAASNHFSVPLGGVRRVRAARVVTG